LARFRRGRNLWRSLFGQISERGAQPMETTFWTDSGGGSAIYGDYLFDDVRSKDDYN